MSKATFAVGLLLALVLAGPSTSLPTNPPPIETDAPADLNQLSKAVADPLPVKYRTVEPKYAWMRDDPRQPASDSFDAASKMMGGDAQRLEAARNGTLKSFYVKVWTDGEPSVYRVPPTPEHFESGRQTWVRAHVGMVLTAEERAAIEAITPINGSSPVRPVAILTRATTQDVDQVAGLPFVYLIEIVPYEIRLAQTTYSTPY